MGLNGQVNTQAALSPGRSPQYWRNRELDGPQCLSECFEYSRVSYICRESNHNFSVIQPRAYYN